MVFLKRSSCFKCGVFNVFMIFFFYLPVITEENFRFILSQTRSLNNANCFEQNDGSLVVCKLQVQNLYSDYYSSKNFIFLGLKRTSLQYFGIHQLSECLVLKTENMAVIAGYSQNSDYDMKERGAGEGKLHYELILTRNVRQT